MFERFTERARKVVVLAQDEARHFNHNYIGTEHLLLGLGEGDALALAALDEGAVGVQGALGQARGHKDQEGHRYKGEQRVDRAQLASASHIVDGGAQVQLAPQAAEVRVAGRGR